MRHAKTLGLMLLAVFALSAVMVSAASAAEAEILGAKTATTKDNGTASFLATGGGLEVKCTSSEGTVTPVTGKETTNATFDELFLGCTAGGFKCTGSKDTTTGSILATGGVEIVAIKEGATLKAVEIFTINEVEFSCLGVLTKVRGSVVGKVDNPAGEKTTKILALLIGKEGKNEITEVNGVKHHLESSTGGGAFVESDQNQNVTATGSEVEVMY
jgi:hypothetical protein